MNYTDKQAQIINNMETFISYAWGGESEKIVNEIDETLQDNGITILRDKRDLGFKGVITEFMKKIGEGHAVISVISDKYLKSPYCMFELLEIYRNLNFKERIFPIVLDDANIFEPIPRLRYLKHWQDKKKELDDAIIQFGTDAITVIGDDYKIYKKIFDNFGEIINVLKDINSLTPEIHRASNYTDLISNLKQLSNKSKISESKLSTTLNDYNIIPKFLNPIPFYDKNNLVGRENLIHHIHNQFTTSNLVVLNGVGGIGKTTIAISYINQHEYSSDYDHICFISNQVDIRMSLMTQINNINFEYNADIDINSNFEKFIYTLYDIQGKNLLVIDNLNEYDEFLSIKNDLEKLRWKVIITSRIKPRYISTISVNELTEEQCIILFKKYYHRDFDESDLIELLNYINFHTLLIELVAKVANKNKRLSLNDILAYIKQEGLKSLHLNLKIETVHGDDIDKNSEIKLYPHILTIFKMSELEEIEMEYLRYFSILPYIEISITNLFDIFQIENSDENIFIDTLDDLEKKGWLSSNNDKYKMHPLIQFAIREKLKPNLNNCFKIVDFYLNKLQVSQYDNPILKQKFLLFAETVYEAIYEENVKIAILSEYLNIIYTKLRNYDKALHYGLKSIEIRENEVSNDYFGLAMAYNNVGITYNPIESEKALSYILKAIDIYKKSAKQSEIEYAKFYSTLSRIYRRLDKLETALEYGLKSLKIRENNYEPNHPSIASSIKNIAVIYNMQGNFQNGLEYNLRSLQIRELVYQSNHPSLANSYENIALNYIQLNNYLKANIYIDKALNIREIHLDKEHPKLKETQKLKNEINEKIKKL